METILLFDRGGRFLARVSAAELPRVVAERGAADGWAIADGRVLWESIGAVLARVETVQAPISGVHRTEVNVESAVTARRAG